MPGVQAETQAGRNPGPGWASTSRTSRACSRSGRARASPDAAHNAQTRRPEDPARRTPGVWRRPQRLE